MKINQEEVTPAVLSLPRIGSKLENIADNLVRFAVEFGVVTNEHFGPRLATIGFTNGVFLGLHVPKAAAQLEELLAADAVPLPEELVGLTPALIAAFPEKADWTYEINCFLRTQWRLSADDAPANGPRLELLLRILHGIRFGLLLTRESPQTAIKIEAHARTLWFENRFLSSCLLNWSQNDWKPFSAPFVEFTAENYPAGSVVRRVVGSAVAEVYPIAKALDNPWRFSFWVETGWSGGRRFAGNHAGDCRKVLEVDGPTLRRNRHELYQRCVLGTARSDGEVQIERATLRFIGEHADVELARSYCSGREPRRLARFAYDFAFWMGIFSSFPVPIIEN